jgi:hypothetical protein
MEIAEMKRLLNEAKSSGKPIGCAVGMSKDAKTALILMHRSHQGPEVGRNLKAATPDIVNMRFGTAQIDEEDHKLVRLVLNRPVTGIAKKLIKTLKGTGFNKVKLGLEDGTPVEGAEDEEQEGVEKETEEHTQQTAPPPPPPKQEEVPPDAETLKKQLTALAARIPAAAGTEAARAALLKLAREGQTFIATNSLKYAATSIEQLRRAIEAASGGTATSTPTPIPTPPTDLLATLTALTRRIPVVAAGDAALQGKLVKLVGEAQGHIKANDTAAATASIEALRAAIEQAAPPENQAAADALRQSGREWLAARQTVEDELDKLRATIAAAYEGQSVAAEIEKKFREVSAPVLRTLDASFATKLEEAGKAPDAAQRQILVQDAKTILKGYETFVQTGLLGDLDDNPFVPLSLRASLTGTISQLAAALG